MADNSKIAFTGGAGAAIGVAIGMLFGGPDVSGIEESVGSAGSEISAISGQLSELGDRLSALEESAAAEPEVPAVTAEQVDAAVGSLSGELSTRLNALEGAFSEQTADLSSKLDSASDAQVEAIIAAMDARYEERMREYRERMQEYREQHGNRFDRRRGKPGDDTGSAPADTTEETMQAPDAGSADEAAAPQARQPRVVTETIELADGKVRAYVSGYLADEDVARVALNGFTVSEIRRGRAAEVTVGDETCRVTFTGIEDGHVQLDVECE